MKIAIATDDGRAVSMHFGRAAFYAVLTLKDGSIVERERRPKFSPHGTAQAHVEEPGFPHGTGPAADARHDQMATVIADCEALLCGGMGGGAYSRLMAGGIRPVVTDIRTVDEAALAYARGEIVDHVERLH